MPSYHYTPIKFHPVRYLREGGIGRNAVVVWLLLCAVAIPSSLITRAFELTGIAIPFAGTIVHLTVYFPLLICIPLALWFGFWWAVIPAYLGTFLVALVGGMPVQWVLVFALSNPLGIGLFLLVYQVAPLRVDLRSPVSFWGFLALALVAALAGSAGSFIWAHTNAVGLNQFYPVWQGWWLGGFLQSALITTPTLWLLGPVVLRKLTPLRGARSSEKVRRGPLLVAIFGVLGTLIGFVFIGRYFGLVRASMVESSLPVELRDDFQNVVSAFSSAQWIMMMAIALAGYFAYQSVIHWTTTLREANRELEQSNVRLTQLSTTDPLTGIFNRRQIFEVLAGEYSKARREGGALCVMMADLDHFKKINDQYGHQVGDFALQTAVSRINSVLRRYDRIGRYGGEEFLLILPGVDAEGALQVAARIVDAVRGLPVQADSTVFDMTVSVGLAALTSHDADVDALINRADKALYAAKSGGRDRVELAKPPEAISPSASRSEAD